MPQKFHYAELAFKRFVLIVCGILFSTFIFSQKTFEEGKTEIDQLLQEKVNVSEVLLDYFDSEKSGNFQSKETLRRIYKYSATLAEKEKGAGFAELFSFIGKRLFSNGFYEDAFYYLYKANQSIKDNPPKDRQFLNDFHQAFGLAYYYYKRYEDARMEFQQVLHQKDLSVDQRIGMLNTYALILREQKEIDSAKFYFSLALNLSEKSHNEPWIGVLSGNLGHIYFLEKKYAKAFELCEKDYKLSMSLNQYGSAINALGLLITMDIEQKKIASAQNRLFFLDSLIHKLEYNVNNYRVLYASKTAVAQAEGRFEEALDYYKIVEQYEDSITERRSQENLKKTEFQINFEQKQAELTLLKTKKKLNEIVIYGLIGITVLLIAVFVWILRMNARRRRREQELSELKQEKVQRELNETEFQLRNMLTNLMEKNSLIENLTAELEEINQSDNGAYSEEKVKMLERLQSFTLLTDDDWLEFKNLFEKLNPTFFTKVLTHSPDLTNAELRLITLIKLNLSNLEMSRILGISPDSVRKTSLRLRKKWGMDHPEDLVKFILSL